MYTLHTYSFWLVCLSLLSETDVSCCVCLYGESSHFKRLLCPFSLNRLNWESSSSNIIEGCMDGYDFDAIMIILSFMLNEFRIKGMSCVFVFSWLYHEKPCFSYFLVNSFFLHITSIRLIFLLFFCSSM